MKRRFIAVVCAFLTAFVLTAVLCADHETPYVAKDPKAQTSDESWNSVKANYINSESFSLTVDGEEKHLSDEDILLTSSGYVLLSRDILISAFGIAVNVYEETSVIMIKGSAVVSFDIGDTDIEANGEDMQISCAACWIDDILYIPEELLTVCMGYEGEADTAALTASYTAASEELSTLPSYYSGEDYGRLPSVKNQGELGACWALAAVSALEAYLLPEDDTELSADHMIYNSGFGTSGDDGGDQIMSMSYLLSWKGPVLESEDPYADGVSDSSLTASYHVQEIQYLPSKDYEAIKQAVILYGAVETSIYMAAVNGLYVDHDYYNYSNSAYCYDGTSLAVNHEVVIIGWDDDYPAQNFAGNVESDGAFICLNSWGEGFGSSGIFYISYEDIYVGTTAVAYSCVESSDNYDNIYQYDDVGWTANIGYGKNTAYMANIYTADSDEVLEAVGFYATGENTDYEVYVIQNCTDESMLSASGTVYASGTLENSGYYTITLDEAVELEAGESFAVIVMVDTTGQGKPLACEMDTQTERTSTVSTEGKSSYISSNGSSWENCQTKYEANICLKAYTSSRVTK